MTNLAFDVTFNDIISSFAEDVSLVFCCYQQVCVIFNMSCLGVILQVRGRDGMSTPQNGVAAYSQSHVSRICQGGFPLPSLHFPSF